MISPSHRPRGGLRERGFPREAMRVPRRGRALRRLASGHAASITLLLLTLGLAGTASAAQPVDVVFVLDNSGSMKTNDPSFLTRGAVSNFVDALARNDALDGRIALVLFDGHARLAQPLTPATDIAGTLRLESALDSLDFSGQRTHSAAGIERALYELRERGRDEARQAIIFLTDGQIDTGDPQGDVEVARSLREDLASESAANDIRIFGIAFTDAADYQLMQALARRTRARYYRAFAASELVPVIDDVLSKIAEPPVYERAYVDAPATPRKETAERPDVSAAPLAEDDRDDAGNLQGWLPVVLLLAGGAVLLRRRSQGTSRLAKGLAPPVPPAQLLDLGGQVAESGDALPLCAGRTRIGRDPHNDLVLDHDTISSEHAVIEVRGGRYRLQDLRSTNGTRIDDRRLAPEEWTPLKGGDHVRFAEVDLMFVMEGYVPGGATVYLSHSTAPPADGSVLPDSTDAGHPPASGADRPDDEEPTDDDAVAERLDPASGVDLDAALMPENDTQPSLVLLPDSEPDPEPEVATEPERAAAPVEVIPVSALRACLDYHLARVAELSPAFEAFVGRAFDGDLREALPVAARDLVREADRANDIRRREYTHEQIRFVLCGVPGPMAEAKQHFLAACGGFSRLLTEELHAESFRAERCEVLALLCFGFDDHKPWVSLSIVPDADQEPRIDLLSYEFLTDAERREIEPNIDPGISQSGFV